MAEKMTEEENGQKFPVRYVLVAALVILGSGLSLFFSVRPDEKTVSARYETLFSGKLFTESELLEVEMAFAAAELSDYRITDGVVEIPKRQKNAFILALKKTSLFESGMEKGASSGFWVSEKERQSEILKEKQDVLAKQLRTFHGIENARVILDVCEAKKGFVREKQATASVSIRSRSGYEISQDDVQSILNLVTGAVCGLSGKNVSIVDTRTNRSWTFNEPEVETASEVSTGDRVNLRKIVFQGEDLPRPEIFDLAAREILERENKSEGTRRDERSLGAEADSNWGTDSLKSEGDAASETVSAPGTVRIVGGKVVVGKRVAEKTRNNLKKNLIFDPHLVLASGVEAEKAGSPKAGFRKERPQRLPELDSPENSVLPTTVDAEMDALSSEMALSDELLGNDGNPFRSSAKRLNSWPWEATAFFGVASVLVCGICLLALFMTRKGLFVASPVRSPVRREELETRDEEKNADADSRSDGLQTATFSSETAEKESVQELVGASSVETSSAILPSEESRAEKEIETERDESQGPESRTTEVAPRSLSEILSTLESIKQEETSGEMVSERASSEEKSLLPEIERLIQVPARRLALAFLEEGPQTAAMLLIHFPQAQRSEALKQIPTNRRLEIEARLAECSTPDEEILRDAAEAILEHLNELETLDDWDSEGDLNPAEILFQREEGFSPSSIRPLGEVLPKEELSETEDETRKLKVSSDEFRNDVEFLFESTEERDATLASETEIGDAENRDAEILDAEISENANSESVHCELASNLETTKAAFGGSDDWKFGDLKYFSDVALKGILTSSDPNDVVLALLGAESGLINRILGVLPRRESSLLGKRLKSPGRIRLFEVENARRQILKKAFELAERGKIELPQLAESV